MYFDQPQFAFRQREKTNQQKERKEKAWFRSKVWVNLVNRLKCALEQILLFFIVNNVSSFSRERILRSGYFSIQSR